MSREHAEFAGRRSVSLAEDGLSKFDAAIICTDHDAVDYRRLVAGCRLIVDTRNVCAKHGLQGDNVVKA
jgi:UDP-N-acetyl-D-glucosamine dehydrogenase